GSCSSTSRSTTRRTPRRRRRPAPRARRRRPRRPMRRCPYPRPARPRTGKRADGPALFGPLRPLAALLAVAVVAVTAWGALALHFAGPRPASLANALAGAWVVVAVAIFALVRPPRRALVAFAVAFAALLVWWST